MDVYSFCAEETDTTEWMWTGAPRFTTMHDVEDVHALLRLPLLASPSMERLKTHSYMDVLTEIRR